MFHKNVLELNIIVLVHNFSGHTYSVVVFLFVCFSRM